MVGNREKLKIVASGSSKIYIINLHNVLYVPQITKNLLSVSKLTSNNNVIVEFDHDFFFVKDKVIGNVLLKGTLKYGLYQLSDATQTNKNSYLYLLVKENWHKKLGHPNNKALDRVLKICNVKTSPSDQLEFCEAYQLGKSHLFPFKAYSSHAQEFLELVHTDVWGPSPINSISGCKYDVDFVDDFSRFAWIYPLK